MKRIPPPVCCSSSHSTEKVTERESSVISCISNSTLNKDTTTTTTTPSIEQQDHQSLMIFGLLKNDERNNNNNNINQVWTSMDDDLDLKIGLGLNVDEHMVNEVMLRLQTHDQEPEDSIDLELRLGPSPHVVNKRSNDDHDLILCHPFYKKRKMDVAGPSNSTSIDFPVLNVEENTAEADDDAVVLSPIPLRQVFPAAAAHHEEDPWEIKKFLKKSDVDGSSRLLIGTTLVTRHVLPHIQRNFDETQGIDLRVWDVNTETEHRLRLKKWRSNSYVFVGRWRPEFVKRRNLKENDEIGLRWDDHSSRLEFSLLNN